MISGMQRNSKRYEKLSLEEKLLQLNQELLATAREAGVTLPR
jgi:hypothetical protein